MIKSRKKLTWQRLRAHFIILRRRSPLSLFEPKQDLSHRTACLTARFPRLFYIFYIFILQGSLLAQRLEVSPASSYETRKQLAVEPRMT